MAAVRTLSPLASFGSLLAGPIAYTRLLDICEHLDSSVEFGFAAPLRPVGFGELVSYGIFDFSPFGCWIYRRKILVLYH
jgi:hypothetical protein